MKPKTVLFVAIAMALAGAGGWFAARRWPGGPSAGAVASGARTILYYQSSMHPWIKSDKPGKCTICGMDLVPVYQGEAGFQSRSGLVTLSSNAINVLNVRTEPVHRQTLRRTIRVAGTIDDDETRHRVISAYVDGRIDRLLVNYAGAEVVENQPLAAIYSPMLLAAEREYVSLLEQRPGGAGLGSERTRLIEAAAQRLRRLGLTEAQIATLPQKSETNLDSDVVAPISGTVVVRNIYEGQYVKEGDPLFEVSDFSTMWFRFDAYERDLAWLRPGQRVEVTLPAVPGRVFSASISFIDPNLNDSTRSAKVRVEIPNPIVERDGHRRRELDHRLYAEAVVEVDAPEVLAVPRGAVLSPDGHPIVYVAKGGGAYERRTVTLGRRGDEFWEVLGGLTEGEMIVLGGNLLIDAQAQLNQSAMPSGPTASDPQPTNGMALSQPQQIVTSGFLSHLDAAGSALASDNLDDFNQAATSLHSIIPKLLDAFDPADPWHPLLQKIAESAHLERASDIQSARQTFLHMSLGASGFVRELRRQPSFKSLRIFECPMVNSAIPGAPRTGVWVQLNSPLRNPFFGSRMIDCGTEVK